MHDDRLVYGCELCGEDSKLPDGKYAETWRYRPLKNSFALVINRAIHYHGIR